MPPNPPIVANSHPGLAAITPAPHIVAPLAHPVPTMPLPAADHGASRELPVIKVGAKRPRSVEVRKKSSMKSAKYVEIDDDDDGSKVKREDEDQPMSAVLRKRPVTAEWDQKPGFA